MAKINIYSFDSWVCWTRQMFRNVEAPDFRMCII